MSKPSAAAVAPNGRVFVVSGNTIVQATAGSTDVKPLVQDPELDNPGRLAYDPASNDLLVNNGKHVRRYSAADGKLVAVYGRPKGRTYGVFNPLDFDGLTDIAADGKGGFFTVEAFPRRVAHFRGRDKHELVCQWIGGLQWGAMCAMDPADPTVFYAPADPKHLGRAKADLVKHTWTLTHLYDLPDPYAAVMPPLCGFTFWEVRHVAADTFLVDLDRLSGGGVSVMRVDDKANRIVPAAKARD